MQNKDKSSKIEHMFDINKNYPEFYQFMGAFAADVDASIFDDEYTIKSIYTDEQLKNYSKDIYQEYLKIRSQAEELMNMDPFPIDHISYSAGGLDTTKEWLKKVLDLLEKRVTGKI